LYLNQQKKDDVLIIINPRNLGQINSIDRGYSNVDTKYIFHLEDDWEFYDYGFIEKSKAAFEDPIL
jgi:hypothetical protein